MMPIALNIGHLLWDKSEHIVLTVSEIVGNPPDLSRFGLQPVMHDKPEARGLTVYVSRSLSHYFDLRLSRWSIYGIIELPSVGDLEAIRIGFVGTYRSPSLDGKPVEYEDYFRDFGDVVASLCLKCPLTYVMGDWNANMNRVCQDTGMLKPPTKARREAYEAFMSLMPGEVHHHHAGITHRPHQKDYKHYSQLDYMCVIHSGKFPRGQCRVHPNHSDHFALELSVSIPYLELVRVEFEKYVKYVDVDYDIVESNLLRQVEEADWADGDVDVIVERLEWQRQFLMESCSRSYTCTRPRGKSKLDVEVELLRNKALVAYKKGMMADYRRLVDDIRVALTDKFEVEIGEMDQNRLISRWYAYHSSIVKPCRNPRGKNVAVNKSVVEVTDQINANYVGDYVSHLESRSDEIEFMDEERLLKLLDSFDFVGKLKDLDKVPEWFKLLKGYVIAATRCICKCIVVSGYYPACLKVSKADILPARTIFQILNPIGKLVECFLAEALVSYVDRLSNFAYRKGLSCTSLLLQQFDILAREKCIYAFNGDLVKAFDRLSRRRVLDNIKCPLLSEIIRSWMDRSESPYVIWWRERYNVVDRSKWNRGVEPGSILGPVLFIIGLDDPSFFNNSLFKGLFADDGLPLYRSISTMEMDAKAFVEMVYGDSMALHLEGEKALNYLVIGIEQASLCSDTLLIDTNCSAGSVEVLRSHRLKQLGVYFKVVKGRIYFDMEVLIGRLKSASAGLARISSKSVTSQMIKIVHTYVKSVVQYAICVWYPLLRDYDPTQLNSLRYWYYSSVAYCCMDSKEIMSWGCNAFKSMRAGISVENRLKVLTGLPSLEDLYRQSCVSHYDQIVNMVKLGILKEVVKVRNGKLLYLRSSDIIRSLGCRRVSPLKCLIEEVDLISKERDQMSLGGGFKSVGGGKLTPWLAKVEEWLKPVRNRSEIRQWQKCITLEYFELWSDCVDRKRLSDTDIDFYRERSSLIVGFVDRIKRQKL